MSQVKTNKKKNQPVPDKVPSSRELLQLAAEKKAKESQ